jgi:hypothetical protein
MILTGKKLFIYKAKKVGNFISILGTVIATVSFLAIMLTMF